MKSMLTINIVLIAIVAIFTGLSGCATLNKNEKWIVLPGTGVKLKVPAGIAPGPAGSVLLDEAGETVINFAVSDEKRNAENDPAWRAIFKQDPEKISTRAISGNLYHRTRFTDGGAWDGWFLAIPRGNKILTVTAMYTGGQPGVFDQLPNYLKTITWDETQIDPEVAVGVDINPRGFQLQKDVVGSLLYRAADEGELLVQPMPVSKAQSTLDKFKEFCESMGDALAGKPFLGPYYIDRKGIQTCEIWDKSDQPEMRYIALVRLPNGALFNAMGISAKNRFKNTLAIFRSAIRELKPIPRTE